MKNESAEQGTEPTLHEQQLFVIDFALTGTGHGFIKSVAGSGKSHTLKKCVEAVCSQKTHVASTSPTVLLLAFNNSTVDELKSKKELQKFVNSHLIEIVTTHTLGKNLIELGTGEKTTVVGVFGNDRKPDGEKKKRDTIKGLFTEHEVENPPTDEEEWKKLKSKVQRHLIKVASMIQNTLTDWRNKSELKKLEEKYFKELSSAERDVEFSELFRTLLPMLLDKCLASRTNIDFDDMVWMPYTCRYAPISKYTHVFVDEVQDLNKAQIELIKSVIDPNVGRIIVFGDDKQAIYAFRGAHSTLLLEQELKPTALTLSVSYRCPEKHVQLVNSVQIAQQMQSGSTKEGAITENVYEEQMILLAEGDPNDANNGDLILCRKNKKVVIAAYKLCRAKKRVQIIGESSIGLQLLEILDTHSKHLDQNSKQVLEQVKKSAVQAGAKIASDLKRFRKINEARNVEELYSTLEELIEEEKRVDHGCTNSLRLVIQDMFEFDVKKRIQPPFIRASTIHRAKGLGSDRVWIIVDPLKSHMVKNDWQTQEERNIVYVSWTRSKQAMFFVGGSVHETLANTGVSGENLHFENDELVNVFPNRVHEIMTCKRY